MTDALGQQRQAAFFGLAGDFDDVLLLRFVPCTGQHTDHFALLSEDRQAAGVIIQRQQMVLPQQVTLQWLDAVGIVLPVFAIQQHLADAFRLGSDRQADRLVQQEGDGGYFAGSGTCLQLDALFGPDLDEGRFDQLAVDGDPAALDIQLRLAPGTAELLGDAFGKAHGVGHGMLERIRREAERGEPWNGSPKAVRISRSLLADGDLAGRALGLAAHAIGDGLDFAASLEKGCHLCGKGLAGFGSRFELALGAGGLGGHGSLFLQSVEPGIIQI